MSSDFDAWTYEPSEEDLIAMYANASDGGGVYGKTPANRLNFLQDIEQSLGVPLVQLMGLGAPAADPLPPAPLPPSRPYDVPVQSQQRAVYGGNDEIERMFDEVDAGADPYTVIERLGPKAPVMPTDRVLSPQETKVFEQQMAAYQKQRDFLQKAVTDYAFERQTMGEERARAEVDYANQMQDYDRQMAEYEQEIAGKRATYTLPSGKKYHGDTDIMGFQNEWELMGSPEVPDLERALAMSRGSEARRPERRTMLGPDAPRGRTPRMETDVTPRSWTDGLDDMGFDAPAPTPARGRSMGPVGAINQGAAKNWSVKPNAKALEMGRPLVEWELGKRKNTAVRSDANKDLMLKILALRSVAGI